MESHKKWSHANPERDKEIRHKWAYGLAYGEFKMLCQKQKFKCAICKLRRKLNVDHHHGTKKVRGLLCQQCNAGLGLLQDSISVLQAAIQYLK